MKSIALVFIVFPLLLLSSCRFMLWHYTMSLNTVQSDTVFSYPPNKILVAGSCKLLGYEPEIDSSLAAYIDYHTTTMADACKRLFPKRLPKDSSLLFTIAADSGYDAILFYKELKDSVLDETHGAEWSRNVGGSGYSITGSKHIVERYVKVEISLVQSRTRKVLLKSTLEAVSKTHPVDFWDSLEDVLDDYFERKVFVPR